MNGEKNLFLFKPVMSKEVKTMYSLKTNKGSLSCIIPVKMLNIFSRSFLPYLTGIITHFIAISFFSDELKLAEVTSSFPDELKLTKITSPFPDELKSTEVRSPFPDELKSTEVNVTFS